MSSTTSEAQAPRFSDLDLPEPLLRALADVGYETPTPIQAETIPALLEGRDLLGQAQTGTGKTAAFALPVLAKIDTRKSATQALVLAPTRELAIQVAEAFQKYAAHLPGFHVLPVYGGQSYGPQLSALRRGAHVVVGTPGRVIDHMDRGTLQLNALKALVLDEADEMLRMGFIDDVEKILGQTPPQRQVALFSATMPAPIRRIAQKHLKMPAEITIRATTTTAKNIRQRYWVADGASKLEALTRILEAEPFDGMIVFVRTKQATTELAERLVARGFAVAPLSGDVEQKQRERTVARLKKSELDIIVATDVAARGLDVERISHVINYDIPHDTEAYVHRIGRTGRAGRKGEAILFVAPRERNMLRIIERATRQHITPMELPSAEVVNDKRIAKFMEGITQALGDETTREARRELQELIERYQREHPVSATEIAAALALAAPAAAVLVQSPAPALAPAREARTPAHERERPSRERKPRVGGAEAGMETFRVEVGRQHGVKPGNLVGAIANEAGLDGSDIGRIEIFDDYSHVDLPEGMPKDTFRDLQKVWVVNQQLRISRVNGPNPPPPKKFMPPKKTHSHQPARKGHPKHKG
ncbi:MAG TPA: DEAD/DEAH box helicase [Nevskiaceae bacterium]|nr:DEAD/DEAH box helicase [Nevskiaceae bacterium]